jgi:adenosine deaminase
MNYKEIPKAELHCHLEGCFRPETVMEIGNTLGMDIPQDPAVFREDWLLSRPLENLEVALKHFVDIQKVWCSEEVIERLTFEACEDAVEQGIRIMEFRYASWSRAGSARRTCCRIDRHCAEDPVTQGRCKNDRLHRRKCR